MSEFIEIQEVAARRDKDGVRILKDMARYCINKDQIVSVSSPDRAEGCVSLLMVAGKPIWVRGTVESITGVKPTPPPAPKPEVKKAQTRPKKAKAKPKEKARGKFGYWD